MNDRMDFRRSLDDPQAFDDASGVPVSKHQLTSAEKNRAADFSASVYEGRVDRGTAKSMGIAHVLKNRGC